jgi:hypothetical protein
VSSTFRVDYVDAAFVALLNDKLPAAYAAELGVDRKSIDIDSLGEKDFNAKGQLTMRPPSVRLRYMGSAYQSTHDNQRLTYQPAHVYELLAFESSLRSKADQRRQTLVLVSCILDQLAGARLDLQDGSKAGPISIQSVELVEADQGPIDQLYAVRVSMDGFAQFSGVNRNTN